MSPGLWHRVAAAPADSHPLLSQLLGPGDPSSYIPILVPLCPPLQKPPGSQCYPPHHFALTGEGGASPRTIGPKFPMLQSPPSLPFCVVRTSLFCMLDITEIYPSATRHQKPFHSHHTRRSFKRNLIELKLFVFYESRYIHLGQNRDILVNLKFMASFIANHPRARAVWLPEL